MFINKSDGYVCKSESIFCVALCFIYGLNVINMNNLL
ncbi:hypothetical protein Gromo_00529 [Candidatus Gromoviella agglomerans]|nr:hypothetical protein Gromo_00528 [Candidatus Gromoviella agglomerans]UFX98609.1 hypothetical protein Gromo_00529 [Candidatus Gromoviella agglomerans]